MIDKTKNPTVYSSLETALHIYINSLPKQIDPDAMAAFRAGYSACLSDFVRLANESKAKRGDDLNGRQ